MGRAKRDGLGAVDHRAAANGQDEVDLLGARKLDALAHQANLGVGAHAGELHVGDASGLERGGHAGEKPCAYHGAAAVYQKDALGPKDGDLLANLVRIAAAKHKACGGLENEVVHDAAFRWQGAGPGCFFVEPIMDE